VVNMRMKDSFVSESIGISVVADKGQASFPLAAAVLAIDARVYSDSQCNSHSNLDMNGGTSLVYVI